MVNQNPSLEELAALWGVCVQWIEHSRPSCPESLLQVERVNEKLSDLAEEICSIVGYFGGENNNDDILFACAYQEDNSLGMWAGPTPHIRELEELIPEENLPAIIIRLSDNIVVRKWHDGKWIRT